jgi:hypothetical protein
MSPTLSKSTYLRGTQCQKSLYLHWHQQELRDPVSPMQQAIFSQGTDVGKLARKLFPGGVDAGIHVPDNYSKSIEMTSQLISEGADVIYEAGFSLNGLHCFVDILVRDGNGWKAFEVKSSTNLKPVNLLDAAFQYHVMTSTGLKVNEISLVILNSSYKRTGEINIASLFKTEPVTEQVLKLQPRIRNDIAEFQATLDGINVPAVDIGPHCFDPYDCDFHSHCWKHVPEYSIFDISRLSGDKKWELYRKGIMKFEDIPPGFRLNDAQWQQVQAELKNETHIDRDAISKFVKSLHYPLYFLDFESFQPAVPLFEHSRPYQQIVFQYSLHLQESPTSELHHISFLAEADGTDPRVPFIGSLIRDIGTSGDIIVFNRSFEASRLNEIAASFPEYNIAVKNIVNRIKDMMLLFQQRLFYVPEMRGSYSIKQVLPALVPGFGYDNLPIADGGSASMAFTSLIGETDLFKIMEIRQNLLEYCKLDTLAMVEILRVLSTF